MKKDIFDITAEHNQEAFEKMLAIALAGNDQEKSKAIIKAAHIADLAGFLNHCNQEQKQIIIKFLDQQQLKNLIVELDANIISDVIELIGHDTACKIINSLDVDDAIYVLDSLEDGLDQVILNNLKGSIREELKEGLSFPEGSVGRLMQRKMISVPDHWTINKTLEYIRKKQNSEQCPEVFYEIFVTNKSNSPIGSVALSVLIAKPMQVLVSEVMQKAISPIKTDLNEEEVAYLFKKYGFISLPVVNRHNRLVGVVTLDDAFELMNKQAEENIIHMGGVGEDDVHLDFIEVIKSRLPWLIVSLFAAIICSLVVDLFHNTIQSAVILSSIMPIVAAISGNAGTQTMTVTVLSISSKELTSLNIKRVVLKQISSCCFNGLLVATLGGVILGIIHHNMILSLVFALAVVLNFTLAGLFGSTIPIILNKMKLDPAIASPVFVTTLSDILSFAIFLGLATKLLI